MHGYHLTIGRIHHGAAAGAGQSESIISVLCPVLVIGLEKYGRTQVDGPFKFTVEHSVELRRFLGRFPKIGQEVDRLTGTLTCSIMGR